MNFKTEAMIDSIAAFFVLFSAILDPRVSVALAFAFLVTLAIYKSVMPPTKTR